MPSDVNENRNTMAELAMSAGRNWGTVTRHQVRHGVAPSDAEITPKRSSSWAQVAPTTRTTTAMLM